MNPTMTPRLSIVLLTLAGIAHSCDDVNTIACQGLNNKINVCSDACFSQMCQRYCGKCPLKCYHCLSVNPAACSSTEECPGSHYSCIQEKTLSANFSLEYRLGCVNLQVCSQLYGDGCQSPGACRDHRGLCCKTDLCNGITLGSVRTRHISTRHSSRKTTVTSKTICQDIDSGACSSFKRSIPGACDRSCFQHSCPRTCGLCGKSYHGRVGSFTWRNCVPSTAYPYLTFTSVSLSPSPLVIPGNITIGVRGTIHHHLGKDVRMVVHMDKYLLGVWTKAPCRSNFGSCNYGNPCEFLSSFVTPETCQAQLQAHGLPCTCPINLSHINLPPSVFEVKTISESWQWLSTGKFRVQGEMIHDHDVVGCLQFEMDIKRKGSGGFLFG